MGRPLVLGSLRDVLTGETLDDTLDERLRQTIARQLVGELGYEPGQIDARVRHPIHEAGRTERCLVDWLVRVDGRPAMVLRYGPGSITSRERCAVALARIMADEVVPFAVVTNGRDAALLDVSEGRTIAQGLDGIPHHEQLAAWVSERAPVRLAPERARAEARIALAFEGLECDCTCGGG